MAIQLSEAMPEEFAEQLGNVVLEGYAKKPIRFQELKFDVAEFLNAATKNELFGWGFVSADGNKIAQLRRNGIGCSIIQGYTEWNHLRSLTQYFWRVFLEQAGAVPRVNRLATRYINVIDVPITKLDFDEYLTAAPGLPDTLATPISHFLQRVEAPFGADVVAVIIQTLDAPAPPRLPIILDIDVQMSKECAGDSRDIWTALDSLRKIKNDIFFSSVTERALEPYQ